MGTENEVRKAPPEEERRSPSSCVGPWFERLTSEERKPEIIVGENLTLYCSPQGVVVIDKEANVVVVWKKGLPEPAWRDPDGEPAVTVNQDRLVEEINRSFPPWEENLKKSPVEGLVNDVINPEGGENQDPEETLTELLSNPDKLQELLGKAGEISPFMQTVFAIFAVEKLIAAVNQNSLHKIFDGTENLKQTLTCLIKAAPEAVGAGAVISGGWGEKLKPVVDEIVAECARQCQRDILKVIENSILITYGILTVSAGIVTTGVGGTIILELPLSLTKEFMVGLYLISAGTGSIVSYSLAAREVALQTSRIPSILKSHSLLRRIKQPRRVPAHLE